MEQITLDVIIDVDDIMLPLNERVAERAGIDYNKIVTYCALDNPLLSPGERRRLYDAYRDQTLHENLPFYQDAVEFRRLLGIPELMPRIRSNSVSEKSTSDKLASLAGFFGPDLDRFDVRIDLIDMSQSHVKKMPRNAWALIDDSPHNALSSGARHILMRRKPWNTSEWGQSMLAPIKNKIFYYDESGQAVDRILELLERERAR